MDDCRGAVCCFGIAAVGARRNTGADVRYAARPDSPGQSAVAPCAKISGRRADHHRRHRFVIDGRRGRSSTAKNYPSQLAVELKRLFPTNSITVLNRGVNGEEVGDMLKRFDKDVVGAKPDLVLWQLGTNSVIRDQMFTDHGAAIRDGLNKIRAVGADVVLIDPQFAPKVIAKSEAEHMVELIATTAKQEDVDLFRRFNVMKRWREADHMAFESFVSPDGLHLNDWSYACIAKGLSLAIAEAAQRPVMSAKAMAHLVP